MKLSNDQTTILKLAPEQRGVFATSDLEIALRDRHQASFARRVRALLAAGTLRRFLRGWYVSEGFDLATLSQRVAPRSYVSFGNVLAGDLMVGTRPSGQVMAVREGRGRCFESEGDSVVQLAIAPHLFFGFKARDGVNWADNEKATLDVLYYHLRGRRYAFDPFSDIDWSRLDLEKLCGYLERYKNPKFSAFVNGTVPGLSA